MPFDYAVHSDLLVYWTGSDIDKQHDRDWHERNSSCTDHELVNKEVEELRKKDPETYSKHKVPTKDELKQLEEEYLRRLTSILEHGLWMTTPRDSELKLYLSKGRRVSLPKGVARVCFTELRLSQARTHAKHYGRLGIGVKRPFLLDRGGRPVIYLGPEDNRERDAFFRACCKLFREKDDRALLHFLKPMHEKHEEAVAQFYAESEWRIIYRDLLNSTRRKVGYPGKSHRWRCSHCVRANALEQAFLDSLSEEDRKEAGQRLRFLLPLDGWLACIIYPSVSLKSQALADGEIRREICRIKEICAAKPRCRANEVEKGNWPVEMDLDLCRNF